MLLLYKTLDSNCQLLFTNIQVKGMLKAYPRFSRHCFRALGRIVAVAFLHRVQTFYLLGWRQCMIVCCACSLCALSASVKNKRRFHPTSTFYTRRWKNCPSGVQAKMTQGWRLLFSTKLHKCGNVHFHDMCVRGFVCVAFLFSSFQLCALKRRWHELVWSHFWRLLPIGLPQGCSKRSMAQYSN